MACELDNKTDNPICSDSLQDLKNNTVIMDQYINSEEFEVPDRLGIPRKTWAGIEKDAQDNIDGFEDLINDKIIAQGGVEIADSWGNSKYKVINQDFLSRNNLTRYQIVYSRIKDDGISDSDNLLRLLNMRKSLGFGVIVLDQDLFDIDLYFIADFNDLHIMVNSGVSINTKSLSIHFPPTGLGYSGGYKGFNLSGGGSFVGDGISSNFFMNMCHVSNFSIDNISFLNIGTTHLFDMQGCSYGSIKNINVTGSSIDFTDNSVRHEVEAFQISIFNEGGNGFPNDTNPDFYDSIGSKNIIFKNCSFSPSYNESGGVFRYSMRPMGDHITTSQDNVKNIIISECFFENVAPIFYPETRNRAVITIPSLNNISIVDNVFINNVNSETPRRCVEVFHEGDLSFNSNLQFRFSNNKIHSGNDSLNISIRCEDSAYDFFLDIADNSFIGDQSRGSSIAYITSKSDLSLNIVSNDIKDYGSCFDIDVLNTGTSKQNFKIKNNLLENIQDTTVKFTRGGVGKEYLFDISENIFQNTIVSIRSEYAKGFLSNNIVSNGSVVKDQGIYSEAMFNLRNGSYNAYANIISWDGIESPNYKASIFINGVSEDNKNMNKVNII